MVKSKRKAAKKQQPKAITLSRFRGLDSKGLEYARLLADPCGAPLCHPVYPGGDSGFLFRAESVATFGFLSTEQAGVLHWTPGYVNSNQTELLVGGGGATSSSALTVAGYANGPGRQFLLDNCSAVRCVAACLKITYPGAESNRSGRLHYGHTTAGLIDAGDPITVDGVAPTLQHFGRVPPETVEVIWRPNIADTEFNDPRATANSIVRDRKSSVTVAWAGIPASTGITFHFTAIYEWLPSTGKGLAADVAGKNSSRNTMDDVLDYLNQRFDWVRGPLQNMAGSFGQGLARGAVDSVVATAASYYGLMSSRQSRASRQRLMV